MVTRFSTALILISIPLALAGFATAAHAAPLNPPRHAASGQSFSVPSSKRPLQYYLSRDAKRSLDDARLAGPARNKVAIPPTPAGSYRLLSCAGGRCVASHTQIAIADRPEQLVAFGTSDK